MKRGILPKQGYSHIQKSEKIIKKSEIMETSFLHRGWLLLLGQLLF
jgi:hypothetical protein